MGLKARIRAIMAAVAIVAMGVASCVRDGIVERLEAIDSIIEEHPDSALALISAIDTAQIRSDKARALYGMLLVQAQDKCHFPQLDDSMIDFSEQFFSKSRDKHRLLTTTYYNARAKYLSEDLPGALYLFFNSLELSKELGDNFFAGLSSRGLSDIYGESFNSAEELYFAREEYRYTAECNRQPYVNYALLDLARAHFNNGHTDSVAMLTEMLADSAIEYRDSYLYSCALQIMATEHLKKEEYEDAIGGFSELISSGYGEAEDSLRMAVSYVGIGDYMSAAKLIGQCIQSEPELLAWAKYNLYKNSGPKDSALVYLEKMERFSDHNFRSRINQNFTKSIASHYNLRQSNTQIEIKATKFKMALTIVISILVILILCIFVVILIAHNKKSKEQKILLAESLQETLALSNSQNKKSQNAIRQLLASQFGLLEELCSIVIKSNGSKSSKAKIAEHVVEVINELSIDSETIKEMENRADMLYDNIYSDFCADMPSLKSIDRRLFLFNLFGLSNATISLFLKQDSINSIYERKRRLKDKIKSLAQEKAQRYLSFL